VAASLSFEFMSNTLANRKRPKVHLEGVTKGRSDGSTLAWGVAGRHRSRWFCDSPGLLI